MDGLVISIIIGALALLAYKYKDKLVPPKNGKKFYATIEEAEEDYRKIIVERILKDNFYLMRVSCSNCKLIGTIYIENEIEADGSTCPVCMVDGLKVLGKGTKKIIYTPGISDETSEKIETLVGEFVIQGLETGQIEKDGIFRGW